MCRTETETPKIQRPPLLPAGAFVVYLQSSSVHPHIPHPRRKAARTCEDAAGEVRIVHGEMNAGSEAKCQQEMEVCITGGGFAPRTSTPREEKLLFQFRLTLLAETAAQT
jgi:hypothetical protein